MEKKYPSELMRLYKPVYFDRQAEHDVGKEKTSFAPMFSWKDDKLRCRANSSLVKGYQVGDIEMDAQLKDALDAPSMKLVNHQTYGLKHLYLEEKFNI